MVEYSIIVINPFTVRLVIIEGSKDPTKDADSRKYTQT